MVSIQGSPSKCVNFNWHHTLHFGALREADIVLLESVLWAVQARWSRGSVPVGLVRRVELRTLLR